MFQSKTYTIALVALLAAFTSLTAQAEGLAFATVAVNGYDVVSYHSEKRPLRGNGHFVSEHDTVTYLFANQQNKERFDSDPEKYVPAYGGFCAFGVSVGKKFYGDPEVWRIVDGKLYLNLDNRIQADWLKDIPGRIKTADANWSSIKYKAPSAL